MEHLQSVDAQVQISTVSGTIVTSTAKKNAYTIESSASELVALNQLSETLKLGTVQSMIAESADGQVTCVAQAPRRNGSPLLATSVSSSLDNALLASEIAKSVVAQLRTVS
ncbi:hypothetical protein B9G98_01362 [Wickerhamiella sorbophila]|uniref:Uncharacterized protein n=1 Tax=Wickerhamiella sorbophila TaxID=45607 RepID=A0A2T0FFG9_9ASCO|nr:hypothetical protein B9G98_01362 [Wickerhamiella sorbophila]PRT53742.1 hypothetical protein B9G98_01362 [Wickerhamiella sorbophila]